MIVPHADRTPYQSPKRKRGSGRAATASDQNPERKRRVVFSYQLSVVSCQSTDGFALARPARRKKRQA